MKKSLRQIKKNAIIEHLAILSKNHYCDPQNVNDWRSWFAQHFVNGALENYSGKDH